MKNLILIFVIMFFSFFVRAYPYCSFGFGGAYSNIWILFSTVFSILFTIILILLIVWLIKQINKKENYKSERRSK